MRVRQGDILTLYFPIGREMTYHPGVVVSNEHVHEVEQIFYAVMFSTKAYNEEFIFEITPDMVNYRMDRPVSYAKCQLLGQFSDRDIHRKLGRLHAEPLALLIAKTKSVLF